MLFRLPRFPQIMALLMTLLGMSLPGGCQSGPSDGGRGGVEAGTRTFGMSDLDFGDVWDKDWAQEPGEATRPRGAGSRIGDATLPVDKVPQPFWSVLLGTFAQENHKSAASNMVSSCGAIDPRLRAARVHTTAKGSLVAYGNYQGVDDAQARRDLEWIKSIEFRGRTVFPRAILTRVRPAGLRLDERHPHSLTTVRRRYPKVHPLYTLQVSVWGDFGSGKMSPEQVLRSGAGQATRLRARGFEAYFHFDDNRGLCMVTVGLFDHTAIDPQSNFLAPEVEDLMREFPSHLVNGEPLQEFIDPRRPARGKRIQVPKLVEVP